MDWNSRPENLISSIPYRLTNNINCFDLRSRAPLHKKKLPSEETLNVATEAGAVAERYSVRADLTTGGFPRSYYKQAIFQRFVRNSFIIFDYIVRLIWCVRSWSLAAATFCTKLFPQLGWSPRLHHLPCLSPRSFATTANLWINL